jgi:hypothetical protein
MEDQEEPKRLIDATPMAKQEQIDLAAQLQALTLRSFYVRLVAGTLSDTGLATMIRLLMANGWSLDPASVKQNLEEMLTTKVDPKELDEEIDNVFPLRRSS